MTAPTHAAGSLVPLLFVSVLAACVANAPGAATSPFDVPPPPDVDGPDESSGDPDGGNGMPPSPDGGEPTATTNPFGSGPKLYVSPTGVDTADCLLASPCRTVTRASSLAQPGTTVLVAPGDYPATVTQKSGTAQARIRFVSTQRWGARVVSTSDAFPWLNRGDHVDIVGFEVTATTRGAQSPQEGIENEGSYVRIMGNKVHDVALDPGCYGDNGGAGINHGIYTERFNDTIGNLVYNTGGPACTLVHGIYDSTYGGKILNNVVLSSFGGFGIHTYHAATNVTVMNNTVLRASSLERGCIILASDPEDFPSGDGLNDFSVVANNLVGHCPSGVVENSNVGPNNRITHNLVFDVPDGACNTETTCTQTIAAAPLLVNDAVDAAMADVRLSAGSPAVNAGIAAAPTGTTAGVAPTLDFDGWPRTQAPDIGAFELERTGPAPVWPWY